MQRLRLLDQLATAIAAIARPHPVRVAVDGFTASGKTTLANELIAPLERRGRQVVRASLDDFKRPWSERHLYDRESGEGYYRNAYDYELVSQVLLEPLGSGGNRHYRAGHIDPVTQREITDAAGIASQDTILIVDAVFLFRPELNDHWDFRIFVDIGVDTVMARGLRRDHAQEANDEILAAVYRDRYVASEQLYVSEVNPRSLADVVIDNRNLDDPRILTRESLS